MRFGIQLSRNTRNLWGLKDGGRRGWTVNFRLIVSFLEAMPTVSVTYSEFMDIKLI